MDGKARRLRKAVARLGRTRRNETVPPKLRRELVGYAAAERRAGRALSRDVISSALRGHLLFRTSLLVLASDSEPGSGACVRCISMILLDERSQLGNDSLAR